MRDLTGKEKFAVFSPLLLYALYILYLFSGGSRPFLVRWLDACFGLFVALIFCNLLRRSMVDRARAEDASSAEDETDREIR